MIQSPNQRIMPEDRVAAQNENEQEWRTAQLIASPR
jgi:hypothetical protein